MAYVASPLQPHSIETFLRMWDPKDRPQHCSNCRNAIVRGDPDQPRTYCAIGYGDEMDLGRLIRLDRPRQFLPARDCPDFDSMDGD